MSKRFIVAGTDTGVGKTVVAAMLTLALHADYFKPVQAGLDGESDTDVVRRLTALPGDHFLPEVYRLTTPASPHRAAELDGIEIDPARLAPPLSERCQIIEAAGGLLVPITRTVLQIDVFAGWQAPVVLCARTALGGINHALLSIEALRARSIAIHGIVFTGDAVPDTERTICEIGAAPRLGRLPHLQRLDCEALRLAFARHFNRADFTGGSPGGSPGASATAQVQK